MENGKHRKILEECSRELEVLEPKIAKKIRELQNLTPKDAFLEYLRLLDEVSRMKIGKRKKNSILLTLWKYGEKLETIVNPEQKHFLKFQYKFRRFRFIDFNILGLFFIVFLLMPALSSFLWNFQNDHVIINKHEVVTFNENLCRYRTAWLYDFRASMVCVLIYRYGNVRIKLNTTNPWEAAMEVEKLISRIPYDYGRLKSVVTYIQTPEETIGRKIGVCSDFALLIAQIFLYNNITPVYIVHTVFKGDESGGHAAAAIMYNGTLWIVDWGSNPTKFETFVEKIGRIWEVREIRIYKITKSAIILDRIYKAKLENDQWRFAYFLTIAIGIFLMKRKEWWLI
ncbi:transglutaminase-like domain-containing protein [Pyrococcus sp. ST04]|uniref:transglutaminase-like domain-containing protein n=1 Tax=Pyrococcus sp. ST04 TaxID=1183377 RepID=UPI0002605B26|nr:transglutaminase-like domain-containing protein [Pyrococcus sp. ST04]AFK22835.1 hypothetical protein Py04_1261 [Pyrococcus sp. ST04]